jgi:myo-inositol-1(or 4)-monophosphatase
MPIEAELKSDIELLKTAAVAAGIIAIGFFRRDPRQWEKANNSPVSEADIEVDDYLRGALTGARPAYGWLSEESGEEGRRSRQRVFVVDPIDGTRAFLRGDEGWVISLAVVEAGLPIAAVIYAPAADELFEATRGGGARRNGMPISTPQKQADSIAVIPAPTTVHRELQAMGVAFERGRYLPSLANRLMQVVTGTADAAVARRGAHDWDIAAAALILAECGVQFEDICVGRPVFDRESTQHGALLAVRSPDLRPVLHKALKAVYGCPSEEREEQAREQRIT